MRRSLCGVLAVVVLAVSALAQEVEQLGESTWAIISEDSRSANSVVFGGDEYTMLVDPGRTPAEAAKRIELAESLTGTVVRKVVLTSADASCALGVLLLEGREFEVSCHEEARRYLAEHAAEMLRTERESAKTPEEAAIFDVRKFRLPDRSLGGMQRFHLGKHHLKAAYMGPAYSRGDLAVRSLKDSVVAAGAFVFHGQFPNISSDADLRDWKRGLGQLGRSSKVRFVPAHGAVVGAEEVQLAERYLGALESGDSGEFEGIHDWIDAPEFGGSTLAANVAAAEEYRIRTHVTEGPGALGLSLVENEKTTEPPLIWRGPMSSENTWLEVAGTQVIVRKFHEPAPVKEFALDYGAVGSALTADGRLAFVPLGPAGRIACFDIYNELRLDDALVGAGAGPGGFTQHDAEFVLPVSSKGSLVFVNTASRDITALLNKGLAARPAGLVVTPNKRFAIVWYEASSELTLVDLNQRRVVAREDFGAHIRSVELRGARLRILGAVDQDFVSYDLPEAWLYHEPVLSDQVAEVAVMGMIHSGHLESETWGLEEVADTIRRFKPDAVLVEIPPDRWEKAWSDYCVRGVVEEPRVKVFAEYREMMFDLSVELGFEIVPCAGWTKPMNDLRRTRGTEFEESPQWAEARADLERVSAEVEARWADSAVHGDDPRVIHSEEYDRYVREVMDPVGRTQNEMIGPGGWYNINRAHMKLVHEAIDRRPGKRLLVTFGAYHKYMFLDELRARNDIELLELGPCLAD